MFPLPLALVGPSGSGKSTLVKYLISMFPEKFKFSVSSTTRKIRPDEKNGLDYEFLTLKEFQTKIQQNEFIEWAEVHGNLYGTSKKIISNIQSQGKICLLDIDVQGVITLYESKINFNRLCILSKNEEVTRQRLIDRRTETTETLKIRLERMKKENHMIQLHPQIFTNTIINDQLDQTKAATIQLVKKMYPGIL